MLTIGIDFDNTIVDYNDVFYTVAAEKKLIPHDFPRNKIMIHDYLQKNNLENAWIEMQGIVYGQRMGEANVFPQVIDFIETMQQDKNTVYIISHKTRYPYSGAPVNLHEAASRWAEKYLPIPSQHIYFETSKREKINRIKQCDCDVFIDDLPEIFCDTQFPPYVKKILFDRDSNYTKALSISNSIICASWNEVLICMKQ